MRKREPPSYFSSLGRKDSWSSQAWAIDDSHNSRETTDISPHSQSNSSTHPGVIPPLSSNYFQPGTRKIDQIRTVTRGWLLGLSLYFAISP